VREKIKLKGTLPTALKGKDVRKKRMEGSVDEGSKKEGSRGGVQGATTGIGNTHTRELKRVEMGACERTGATLLRWEAKILRKRGKEQGDRSYASGKGGESPSTLNVEEKGNSRVVSLNVWLWGGGGKLDLENKTEKTRTGDVG